MLLAPAPTIAPADEQQRQALAREASTRIARLAAAILIELGGPVDRDAVLTEAAAFLQEVDEEDDGLQHASGALGSPAAGQAHVPRGAGRPGPRRA